MNTINLYGASGHAKVIMDILHSMGVDVGKIFDDNPDIHVLDGINVYHQIDDIESPIIISIGNNTIRQKIVRKNPDFVFGKAVHTSSILSPDVTVGEGSVIMQGTIIQSDAHIGKHCIVNSGASVDHECFIEDFVHISPHATLCGNVTVGEGTWIGAGSTVIQSVNIGKWSVIGAGSVVVSNIPDGVVAYGNPCKIIKKIE